LLVEYFTGRRLPILTAARQIQSSTELHPADVNACQPCFCPLHYIVFICSSLLPFVTVCTTASASCTWTLSPWCDITQTELAPIWKKKKKELLQQNSTKHSVHFENLDKVVSISPHF